MIEEVVSKRQTLVQLCKTYHVQKLELFGSAASEQFDPLNSDLDFLVTFERIPEARTFNCYFDFLCALSELFNRKVDLVEERAIKNPELLQSIQQGPRALLYAAEREELPA